MYTGESAFVQGISDFLWAIYFPLCETYLPALIVLGVCGNSASLVVFLSSRAFIARTSHNARIYYVTLAVIDIIATVATQVPWFLGTVS